MAIDLGSTPAPGFEVPLEMLSACHGRIEAQCALLRRLVTHMGTNGADDEARGAAQAVMRYFDTAAQHHHADEEVDLFPALLRAAPQRGAMASTTELVALLRTQHRELEALWRQLRAGLQRVAAGEAVALDAAVEPLIELYAAHIEREEGELLPLARTLLEAAELDPIGAAMRARRGVAMPQ